MTIDRFDLTSPHAPNHFACRIRITSIGCDHSRLSPPIASGRACKMDPHLPAIFDRKSVNRERSCPNSTAQTTPVRNESLPIPAENDDSDLTHCSARNIRNRVFRLSPPTIQFNVDLSAATHFRHSGSVSMSYHRKGDGALDLSVLGLVDNTRPTGADLLNDPVMRDYLVDHGGPPDPAFSAPYRNVCQELSAS